MENITELKICVLILPTIFLLILKFLNINKKIEKLKILLENEPVKNKYSFNTNYEYQPKKFLVIVNFIFLSIPMIIVIMELISLSSEDFFKFCLDYYILYLPLCIICLRRAFLSNIKIENGNIYYKNFLDTFNKTLIIPVEKIEKIKIKTGRKSRDTINLEINKNIKIKMHILFFYQLMDVFYQSKICLNKNNENNNSLNDTPYNCKKIILGSDNFDDAIIIMTSFLLYFVMHRIIL